jgi:hypothetical protein
LYEPKKKKRKERKKHIFFSFCVSFLRKGLVLFFLCREVHAEKGRHSKKTKHGKKKNTVQKRPNPHTMHTKPLWCFVWCVTFVTAVCALTDDVTLFSPYIDAHDASVIVTTGRVLTQDGFIAHNASVSAASVTASTFSDTLDIHDVFDRMLSTDDTVLLDTWNTTSQHVIPPGVYTVDTSAMDMSTWVLSGAGDFLFQLSSQNVTFSSVFHVAFAFGASESRTTWIHTNTSDDATLTVSDAHVLGTVMSLGSVSIQGSSRVSRVWSRDTLIDIAPGSFVHFGNDDIQCTDRNTETSCHLPANAECLWVDSDTTPTSAFSSSSIPITSHCIRTIDAACHERYNVTACPSDTCHVETIGPDTFCANGVQLTSNTLFYNMPVVVRSIVVTGPYLVEIVVRIPIFQAYDTSGYFSFAVGEESNFNTTTFGTLAPSTTCNSLTTPIGQGDAYWPPTYAEFMSLCHFASDVDVLMERSRLQTWINTYHIPPWQNAVNVTVLTNATTTTTTTTPVTLQYDDTTRLNTYGQPIGSAACWHAILGDINSAPVAPENPSMPAGPVSRWSMPLVNFIDLTLHLNAETVFRTCATNYTGLMFQSTTSPTLNPYDDAVLFQLPLTVLQRTSHRQLIKTSIYTAIRVMVADNITVTTSIYHPAQLSDINVDIESVTLLDAPPLNPAVSLDTAHMLRMAFILTVKQPETAQSLRPVDADDVSLTIPGQSGNCYGDIFENGISFTPILPCIQDAFGDKRCTFRIVIVTAARTDLFTGTSFEHCSPTLPAVPNFRDKLHIFGVYLQLCPYNAACQRVSPDTPLRIISSLYKPVFPQFIVYQNEELYTLQVLEPWSDLTHFNTTLGLFQPQRRIITTDDSLNVALVTRAALWRLFSLIILPADDAIEMWSSTDANAATSTQNGWTLVATQSQLTHALLYAPAWYTLNSTMAHYPGCTAVGPGCDGFSYSGNAIMALLPFDVVQVKFIIRVVVTRIENTSPVVPSQRRLLGVERAVVVVPQHITIRRRIALSQTFSNQYTGTAASSFVFIRSALPEPSTTAATGAPSSSGSDVVRSSTGASSSSTGIMVHPPPNDPTETNVMGGTLLIILFLVSIILCISCGWCAMCCGLWAERHAKCHDTCHTQCHRACVRKGPHHFTTRICHQECHRSCHELCRDRCHEDELPLIESVFGKSV